MPIALPLSRTSHMSAMVPAPTAWTLAAAPPPRTRITINIAILVDRADKTLKIRNNENETRYIVLLPDVSEKLLHQRGKMDMLSMYKATERLVIVGVEWRSSETWMRDAIVGE